MKKRAILVLGMTLAMVLTGCGKHTASEDIIVVSDVKMEEKVPMAESMEVIESETAVLEESVDITAYDENANLLHRVYEGMIGEMPVRFIFYVEENELKEARYILQGDATEYPMNGYFDIENKRFYLESTDEMQMISGELYNYNDNGDRLIGTFLQDGIASDFMVQRVWNVGYSENVDEIYNFLGFDTPSVNAFVDEFVRCLSEDRVEEIGQMLQYPVRVSYAYQDDIILENVEDFVANYDVIFDEEHKNALIHDFHRYFYGYDKQLAAFSARIDIIVNAAGELKIWDISDQTFTVVVLSAPEKG